MNLEREANPRVEKIAKPIVKKVAKIYNVKNYITTKYLFKLEVVYNTVDAIITVTDLKLDTEVEKRYCKTKSIAITIDKIKKEYRKMVCEEPKKVLFELKAPVTSYIPQEKINRNYTAKTVDEGIKFRDCYQELLSCLDSNRMTVELDYIKCGEGKYRIDMIPKSKSMALGLHRVIMDIQNKEFKYLYGYSHTSLKMICKTDSISKLFNNEK